MNPEAVVRRQFEAYNARDLEAFVAQYADDVQAYRPPAAEPSISGKSAFREFYATQRFCHAGLRADLLGRIVAGNKVIDHERVSGVAPAAFELAIVYEVVGRLIRRTWTFPAA